jgi:hypothetical protein
MFEKISRAAETVATRVSLSRRGFLGRLGKTALGAAGVLGGLLVLTNKAQAARKLYSCRYYDRCYRRYVTYTYCGKCPRMGGCYSLRSSSVIGTC